VGLIVYGVLIAVTLADSLRSWPWWAQTIVYLVLGLVWLLPLKRFLIWMETGRWSPPPKSD
jgi:membrane protein implicated in regulation of membrane protease activity